MNKVIVISFLFTCNICFSQTKEDTQNWIKQQFELNVYESFLGEISTYKVSFDSCNFIVEEKCLSILGMMNTTDIIPINRIKEVKFNKREAGLMFDIIMYSGNNSQLIKSYLDISDETKYEHKVVYGFNDKYLKENLTSRIEESFLHLIKLCGGGKLKEPF